MAFKIATSGRPGLVAVALPEDMLRALTEHTDVTPLPIERATPSDTELDTIVGEIAAAERPVIIAGGGRWTLDARADLANFAENNDIPVLAAWRFHAVVDNLSDIYCGEAGPLLQVVRDTITEADLIIGPIRFGETSPLAGP